MYETEWEDMLNVSSTLILISQSSEGGKNYCSLVLFQKKEKFENRLKIDQVGAKSQKSKYRWFLCQAGSSLTIFFQKKITKFFVSFQKKEKFENGLKIDRVGATKPKLQVSPISMPS